MTVGDISSHLLADWIPSLPPSVSPSFIGWPPFLIQLGTLNGNDVLVLRSDAARSERQWKGFLSWMLGVAGTRHVLASDGYRWIAPVSAFYPGAVQVVDLSRWHNSFPRSCVVAERRSGSISRLFPDYLALRPTTSKTPSSPYQWAVAEAKGTQSCLRSMSTCRSDWYAQARNVLVTVNGARVRIPRHFVIATRVNPNSTRERARRLQLRAWNHKVEVNKTTLSSDAVADIVTAHLFGLFRGLRFRENAIAMALSVQRRTAYREQSLTNATKDHVNRAFDGADKELLSRTQRGIAFETEFGPMKVELSEPLITLAMKLRRAESPDAASTALQEADSQLDRWEAGQQSKDDMSGTTILPFGMWVHLPSGFEPRA